MRDKNKEPKNIFEQILYGQEVINDNIVALSENMDILYKRFNSLFESIAPTDTSSPTVSGKDDDE